MTTVAVALRARLAYQPHTWVYLAAGAAALTVVVHHRTAAGPATNHDHHQRAMAGTDSMSHVAHADAGIWAEWSWWTVMAAAMMLPIAARGAGRVARAGLWHRRHIALVEYLGGYLAMWSLAGMVAVSLAGALWPGGAPAVAASLVLLVAAGWQVAPVRRRVLRRCSGTGFVDIRGWCADRDCAAAGAADGRRCVFTCGPAMAVMALSHSLILMAALTLLLLSERSRGPNPAERAGRPLEALGMAGLAMAAAAWMLWGAGRLP